MVCPSIFFSPFAVAVHSGELANPLYDDHDSESATVS